MNKTVASLVVDSLIANGIETLYCVPGVQNDPFFDALYDRQEKLNPLHTRHEQGAAYMALGGGAGDGKTAGALPRSRPGFPQWLCRPVHRLCVERTAVCDHRANSVRRHG